MSRVFFTRPRLREIVPNLPTNQEDAIIDMYLTASYAIKKRLSTLESENAKLKKRLEQYESGGHS